MDKVQLTSCRYQLADTKMKCKLFDRIETEKGYKLEVGKRRKGALSHKKLLLLFDDNLKRKHLKGVVYSS